MKLPSLAAVAALLTFSVSGARADLQFGLGAGAYQGSDFDESVGYGFEGELGFLANEAPVNLFLGARAVYVDGLEAQESVSYGNLYGEAGADMDMFEGALVARLLVPLGVDLVKIYGEGSIGAGNLRVSGNAKARGSVGGQEFSVNSHFDEDDWVLAWGLGAGLQFDFTSHFGLRVGYNFHSFGDTEVFGLNADPGSVHGGTASLIFKF